MKKIITLQVFLFFFFSLFAQKETRVWYFGHNAGLDFSTNPPQVLTNGQLNTDEGCATICDSNGNLLFYTDGVLVWDKEHEVMPNGFDLVGHKSSTQSALIVPKPNSTNFYYVFTVDFTANPNGISYSVLDLSLNGGKGDITEKNILLSSPVCEKITAVPHANGEDFWVIGHEWESKNYLAWLINSNGVELVPVTSSSELYIGDSDFNSIGYLKASIDGSTIAAAHWHDNDVVEVLDFDNETGVLSNPIQLTVSDTIVTGASKGLYGVEFSPSGELLYVAQRTYGGSIFQFDLSSGMEDSIQATKLALSSYAGRYGGLQIASDRKIYVSKRASEYLDVIEQPDSLAMSCNYLVDTIYLEGKYSWIGLPNFISGYFKPPEFLFENVCLDDSTKFTLKIPENTIDSVEWNFGDLMSGSENFSTELAPVHVFSDTGKYEITLITFNSNGADTSIRSLHIQYPSIADFSVIRDGFDVSFSNISLYADAYLWKFGDGTIDNSKTPFHTYNQYGVYEVELITINDCANDTLLQTVEISPLNAGYSLNGEMAKACAPALISFFDNSTGDVDSYEWTFEGGIPNVSNEANPQITYESPGIFDFQLVVTNSTESDTLLIQDSIEILPKPISAFDFSIDSNMVSFENLSVDADSFTWYFGDGSILSVEENPTHEYLSSGQYEVVLTASNGICDSSFTEIILLNLVKNKNLYEQEIHIYPNPASNFLDISTSTEEALHIDIYTTDGKKLGKLSKDFFDKTILDIKGISNGMYFLVLSNETMMLHYRFIKI